MATKRNLPADEAEAPREQPAMRPASEIKAVTRALTGFSLTDLAQIPVIEAGARLRGGAIYVDLADEQRREIKARHGDVAGDKAFLVPKADTAAALWSRLVGGAAPPPRVRRDPESRVTEQGDNELRGGRERSERRGAGAVGAARGSARH